jgi:kynurenine formamidase
MCGTHIVKEAVDGLSRRDLIGLASLAFANGAWTAAAHAAGKPRTKRPLSISTNNILDLTHPLSGSFPIIPIPGLTFPFRLTEIASIEKNGVYSNKWELIEHNGTHIDSPSHFIAGRIDIDAVPVEDLIAPIAVIDITERASRNPDAMVEPDDVLDWERRNGRLPRGAAVFMRSGWDRKAALGDPFIGMDATQTMHFPGFSEAACQFLVSERDISGVGVDTISFDAGIDKEFRAHKALFTGGKWGIECLNNMGHLPPSGAVAVVGAPKVERASGGPCRVFAFWA